MKCGFLSQWGLLPIAIWIAVTPIFASAGSMGATTLNTPSAFNASFNVRAATSNGWLFPSKVILKPTKPNEIANWFKAGWRPNPAWGADNVQAQDESTKIIWFTKSDPFSKFSITVMSYGLAPNADKREMILLCCSGVRFLGAVKRAISNRAAAVFSLDFAIRSFASDIESSVNWYPTIAEINADPIPMPPHTAATIVAQMKTDCQNCNDNPHIALPPLPIWPVFFFLISLASSVGLFVYIQLKRLQRLQKIRKDTKYPLA